MRYAYLTAVLLCTTLLTGCAPSDFLFGALENYYSGGGSSTVDRQYHSQQQRDAWENYNRYGSAP